MGRLPVEQGREVYFERHNENGGLPVLFVHGWGMSSRIWDGVVPSVAGAGHQVITIDARASGSSDKDFHDVSIEAIGSDVVRILDHLAVDEVILNGWSHGGAVVTNAALKLKERVRGLVLTGAATPRWVQGEGWPHGFTSEELEGMLGQLAADRATFLRGISEQVCYVDVGEPVVNWMWQIFLQAGHRVDESLRNLGETDRRSEFSTLSMPALILAGRQDAFVPFSIAQEQASMLPNAKLVEFPECGHATFLENRDKYVEELTDFTRKHL